MTITEKNRALNGGQRMNTMNITLPEELKEYIDAQISTGAYSSASEYVRRLISEDLERKHHEEIEKKLLEALDSGEYSPMTSQDWDELRAVVRRRRNFGNDNDMDVVLERAAKRDLETIALYLEGQAGLEVAERFRFQTEAALTQLASMPLIGSLWRSNHPRLKDLRAWPIPGFRKYLVFYISSQERIEILRILHGARDVSEILKGPRGE